MTDGVRQMQDAGGTETGRGKQEEHELLRSQDNRPGAVEAQV